jgi:hypothetical protein
MEAYKDLDNGRQKQRIVAYHSRVKEENRKPGLKPKQSVKSELEKIKLSGDLSLIYNTPLKLDFVGMVDRIVTGNGTSALRY